MRLLAEDEDQHRAVSHCCAPAEDAEGMQEWLVFLVLWRKTFLMCSCNAAPGAPILGEAEMMFASAWQPARGRPKKVRGSGR